MKREEFIQDFFRPSPDDPMYGSFDNSINKSNYGRNRKLEVNYPTFTGGTLLHPEILPPLRTYRIQEGGIGGGRLVHPEYLPPPEFYLK